MQWRFAPFVVINWRRDLHPQECARAWRTKTRQDAPRRTKTHQEKGPGDHPNPCRWWNRGESNPRPQAIAGRFYMRSCLI
jgi:hypothetical protein